MITPKITHLSDYVSEYFSNNGMVSTNDDYLYQKITTQMINMREILHLTSSENKLKDLSEMFLTLSPAYELEFEIKGHCSLLCNAKKIINFIENNADAFCFTDCPLLISTLEAMDIKSNSDNLEKNLILSSAELLMSPSYHSANLYLLQSADLYKERLNIVQQIQKILPYNFMYLENYPIDELLLMHEKFTLFIAKQLLAKGKIDDNTVKGIRNWFCEDNYEVLKNLNKMNSYQYLDILNDHFNSARYETSKDCDFLIKKIDEILWIKQINKIHIHVQDRAALNRYLPYFRARRLEKVRVSFYKSTIHCECSSKNLLKCAIRSPAPANNLRKKAFSISDVAKLRSCPINFYFDSILNIKQSNLNQSHLIGIMIHHVLEQCIRPGLKSLTEFKANIKSCMDKYSYIQSLNKFDKCVLSEKVIKMVEYLWPIICDAEQVYCEVEGVQEIVKHGESYKLHGRADMVYKKSTGEFGVIDFKTGSIPSWNKIVKGCSPQGPLEILLLSAGSFIKDENIRLGECGLLSPKGFLRVAHSEDSINASIQGIDSLIDNYWIENAPYHEYVSNKYPVFSRSWSKIEE